MKKMVKRISQVGIIVRDLDLAIKSFENDFGITNWNRFNANENFGELIVDERPGKLNILGAIAIIDGFEIELIQPIGEGVYADWLGQHGPGVHHFAMSMSDNRAGFAELMEMEENAGRKPWIHATMKEGQPGEKMDFAYIDRRDDMGAIIEIYNENRE